MKRGLIILTTASFIGMAVFGFMAMGEHELGHDMKGCLAIIQVKIDCTSYMGLIDFASFHLDAFKAFSSTNFVTDFVFNFMIFAMAVVFSVEAKRLFKPRLAYNLITIKNYLTDYGFYTPLERKLKKWFSIRRTDDAAFLP